MVANPINYFDIYDIVVNELVGNVWLFLFLGLILVWYIAIRSRMSTEVGMIFSVIFIGIVFSVVWDQILIVWILVIFGVGFYYFYKYQKIIRQG